MTLSRTWKVLDLTDLRCCRSICLERIRKPNLPKTKLEFVFIETIRKGISGGISQLTTLVFAVEKLQQASREVKFPGS